REDAAHQRRPVGEADGDPCSGQLHALLQRARPSRGRHGREAGRRLSRKPSQERVKPAEGGRSGLSEAAGGGGKGPAHRSSAEALRAALPRKGDFAQTPQKRVRYPVAASPEKWPSG